MFSIVSILVNVLKLDLPNINKFKVNSFAPHIRIAFG